MSRWKSPRAAFVSAEARFMINVQNIHSLHLDTPPDPVNTHAYINIYIIYKCVWG